MPVYINVDLTTFIEQNIKTSDKQQTAADLQTNWSQNNIVKTAWFVWYETTIVIILIHWH